MKTCIAIRHVPFESLDAWEAVIRERFRLDYCEAPAGDVNAQLDPDLLVVLGGPIGVNDVDDYPFLNDTLALLKNRMANGKPTLGICLGAQLMAAAAGARITSGNSDSGAEVGWIPLTLSPAGIDSPLKHLDGVAVFHWHSDTFDLPEGSQLLASTPACAHQGFSIGKNLLGLQFHPEVSARALETWYVGHHRSLTSSDDINVHALRADAARHENALREASERCLHDWLDGLQF